MRSQRTASLVFSLVTACAGGTGTGANTLNSTVKDAPDLSLRGVAFARLSEGRVVARGTAKSVDYRRAGGHLVASDGNVTLSPDSGTELASFGPLHVAAPSIDGEVANRRGNAWGGVHLVTDRGDKAFTQAVAYDDPFVRSQTPVDASGPGYRVHGNGMVARADGSSILLTRGVKGNLEMEAGR